MPTTAFVLQARKRDDHGPVRVGFTVSRKVGTAVERNRVRRRLREIVRLSAATGLSAGHDYVLIGRRAALSLPFEQITEDYKRALRRLRVPHDERQKNTILAIVLSALVLIGWQFYFGTPQQKQIQQQQAQERSQQPPAARSHGDEPAADRRSAGSRHGTAGPRPGRARPALDPRSRPRGFAARADRNAEPRRLDRAQGRAHRRPVARQVPRDRRAQLAGDRLLSPSGTPHPFYAEFGWSPPSGVPVKLPPQIRSGGSWARASFRRPPGDADLGQRRRARIPPHHRGRRQVPVHPQGRGRQQGRAPVTLYPYALISRHGTPPTLGYYILHEGLIGVLGDKGLQEDTYANIEKQKSSSSTPPMPGSASPTNTGRRRWCPTSAAFRCAFSSGRSVTARPTRPTISIPADRRAGRHRGGEWRGSSPAPRRSRSSTATTRARSSTLRAADRLGLVLLHHQADVPGDRLISTTSSAISASPS